MNVLNTISIIGILLLAIFACGCIETNIHTKVNKDLSGERNITVDIQKSVWDMISPSNKDAQKEMIRTNLSGDSTIITTIVNGEWITINGQSQVKNINSIPYINVTIENNQMKYQEIFNGQQKFNPDTDSISSGYYNTQTKFLYSSDTLDLENGYLFVKSIGQVGTIIDIRENKSYNSKVIMEKTLLKGDTFEFDNTKFTLTNIWYSLDEISIETTKWVQPTTQKNNDQLTPNIGFKITYNLEMPYNITSSNANIIKGCNAIWNLNTSSESIIMYANSDIPIHTTLSGFEIPTTMGIIIIIFLFKKHH